CSHHYFSSRTRPPPTSPLFPYTTLFRSLLRHRQRQRGAVSIALDHGIVQRDADGRATEQGLVHRGPRGPHRELRRRGARDRSSRSEEHTSELQSPYDLVCRLLLEKKNKR